jgi:hypothetical protein
VETLLRMGYHYEADRPVWTAPPQKRLLAEGLPSQSLLALALLLECDNLKNKRDKAASADAWRALHALYIGLEPRAWARARAVMKHYSEKGHE